MNHLTFMSMLPCLYLKWIRMAATAFHQAIGSIHPHGCDSSFGSQNGIRNLSVNMVFKSFGVDVRLIARGNCCSGSWKLSVTHASSSHSSVADPVHKPSKNNSSDSKKKPCKSFSSAALVIRWKPSRLNVKPRKIKVLPPKKDIIR